MGWIHDLRKKVAAKIEPSDLEVLSTESYSTRPVIIQLPSLSRGAGELPDLYTSTGRGGCILTPFMVDTLKNKWVEVQGKRWTAQELSALPWSVEVRMEPPGWLCRELGIEHENADEFSRRCFEVLIFDLYWYRSSVITRNALAAFNGVKPEEVIDPQVRLPRLPVGYRWVNGTPTREPGERHIDTRVFGAKRAGDE